MLSVYCCDAWMVVCLVEEGGELFVVFTASDSHHVLSAFVNNELEVVFVGDFFIALDPSDRFGQSFVLDVVEDLIDGPPCDLICGGFSVRADVEADVGCDCEGVGVFVGILELYDALGDVGVGRLGGEDSDESFVSSEDLCKYFEDLHGSIGGVSPAGLPWFFCKAEVFALLAGIFALWEHSVPGFVGVFDVDFQVRVEAILYHKCEVADVVVVGEMWDAEPWVCIEAIGQVDEQLECYAFFAEGCVGELRALRPSADFGAVGVHEVHEAEAGDAVPSFEKDGMPGIVFVCIDGAGHDHADVADVILGVGLEESEEEAALFGPGVEYEHSRLS